MNFPILAVKHYPTLHQSRILFKVGTTPANIVEDYISFYAHKYFYYECIDGRAVVYVEGVFPPDVYTRIFRLPKDSNSLPAGRDFRIQNDLGMFKGYLLVDIDEATNTILPNSNDSFVPYQPEELSHTVSVRYDISKASQEGVGLSAPEQMNTLGYEVVNATPILEANAYFFEIVRRNVANPSYIIQQGFDY